MRNNLTGIIISALLHAALFSWAFAINTDSVTPKSSENIALTVKMFQEAIAPPAPVPVIKRLVKKVTPPTPLNPEFADLPPSPKVKQTLKKPAPESVRVAKKEPKVLPFPELARLEPVLDLVKPEPEKMIKPKIIKKVGTTKKEAPLKKAVKTVNKKIAKKVTQQKIVRVKKITQRKIEKKKIIRNKVKRKVVQKKLKTIKKKVVTKAKRQQKFTKHLAKKTIAKSTKSGGVYSKNKLRKQQLARQRVLTAKRTAIKRKQSKQITLKKTPRVVAVNTGANKTLTRKYKVRLQQLIASKKHYPKRAKRRKQQGKVTVSFRIRHSGIITDIRIIKGARHQSLNKATIAAIKKASGKLLYPKGMSKKSLTLTITLSYILT